MKNKSWLLYTHLASTHYLEKSGKCRIPLKKRSAKDQWKVLKVHFLRNSNKKSKKTMGRRASRKMQTAPLLGDELEKKLDTIWPNLDNVYEGKEFRDTELVKHVKMVKGREKEECKNLVLSIYEDAELASLMDKVVKELDQTCTDLRIPVLHSALDDGCRGYPSTLVLDMFDQCMPDWKPKLKTVDFELKRFGKPRKEGGITYEKFLKEHIIHFTSERDPLPVPPTDPLIIPTPGTSLPEAADRLVNCRNLNEYLYISVL